MNAVQAQNAMKTVPGLAQKAFQTINSNQFVFWSLFVLGIVLLYVLTSRSYKAFQTMANDPNIASIKQQQVAIFEAQLSKEWKDKKSLLQAIQQQGVSDRENCLINFQPLTVIHPGYLGPIKDGVYDEKVGVTTALRMGARCFVLPIDYHDRDTMPASFPPAMKPCLLFRDASDTIRSLNGGSIQKVAQAIADVAWSDLTNQKNDPFILILYFMRTPKEGTKEYLNFLSDVARELQPLIPYLLSQTPQGVYNRQARQEQLLFVNATDFEKKLLVFSNADTSGFRTANRDFKKTYLPKEDLDFWVHLRLFKQNTETNLGITTLAESGGIPRGFLETLDYFKSYPSDPASQRKAIQMTKEKFLTALGPNGTNPDVTTLKTVLNQYGVQSVPLLITDYSPETQALLAEWKYAWRAKPKEIRYVRPEPQTIFEQSKKVDANQGQLTVPR